MRRFQGPVRLLAVAPSGLAGPGSHVGRPLSPTPHLGDYPGPRTSVGPGPRDRQLPGSQRSQNGPPTPGRTPGIRREAPHPTGTSGGHQADQSPAEATVALLRVISPARGMGPKRARLPVMPPLFRYRPLICPYYHDLGPGQVQIGWRPCGCGRAAQGGAFGHLVIHCLACQRHGRRMVYQEPPCDRPQWLVPGGWQPL